MSLDLAAPAYPFTSTRAVLLPSCTRRSSRFFPLCSGNPSESTTPNSRESRAVRTASTSSSPVAESSSRHESPPTRAASMTRVSPLWSASTVRRRSRSAESKVVNRFEPRSPLSSSTHQRGATLKFGGRPLAELHPTTRGLIHGLHAGSHGHALSRDCLKPRMNRAFPEARRGRRSARGAHPLHQADQSNSSADGVISRFWAGLCRV